MEKHEVLKSIEELETADNQPPIKVRLSACFQSGLEFRIGDVRMEVVSVNDKKKTVSLRAIGCYVTVVY